MAEDVETPPIEGGLAKPEDESQGASVRPSAEAAGGIDPQPGDPASPAQAARANEPESRLMRDSGFGDHKGGII